MHALTALALAALAATMAASVALALPPAPAIDEAVAEQMLADGALLIAHQEQQEQRAEPAPPAPPATPAQTADEPLPDFFPQGNSGGCRRSETSRAVGKCIRGNLQSLVPHIKDGGKVGLPSLEPYFVPAIDVNFKSTPVDFHAILSQMNVSGLSNVTVRDARADLRDDSMNMDIDILLPKMVFRGLFEFTNGLFSQYTFKGHGPFEFVFRNIEATWKFQGKKEPGSKYMTITKVTPVYTVGGMKFWAKDLVEGYPALDDIIVTIANRLWKDVVRFGKPAVQKPMSDHITLLSNTVFQRVAYDDIFPPA